MRQNSDYAEAQVTSRKSMREYREISKERQKRFQPFYQRIIQDVLINEESDAPVCSPACMMLWLAVLTEMSFGRTRKQILDAVGMKDAASFSQAADAVWNAETMDEKDGICRLSSSVWLNRENDCLCSRQMELGKQFELSHTDIFAGETGSDSMNRELREWLNEHTGGKLKDQVSGISLESGIQAALFSAIYFKAGWEIEFSKPRRSAFHGEDRSGKCQMMKAGDILPYFRGDQFRAVCLGLTCIGRSVFLILPNEKISINTLLKSPSFYELMEKGEEHPRWEMAQVELYLPQIQAEAQINLIPYLEKEGILDVFDAQAADFSPLMVLENLSRPFYVSQADHVVHLEWDEDGVEGAAYTGGILTGLPPSERENIIFRLDRPFIYLIMSSDGSLLFAGAVRNL